MMQWHWHSEPPVLGIFAALAVIYYLCIGPLRSRLMPQEPFPRKHAAIFTLGLIILFLALVSPIDELGSNFLFSAHMTQHLILMYLVPPLIFAGIPVWLLEDALNRPKLLPVLRVLTKPVTALAVGTLIISFWHFPVFYDGALHNKALHAFEHVTFVFASLLIWWPILSPMKSLPRIGYGQQLLYIFFLSVAQLPLFGFVTFAPEPLYPTYDAAPRILDTHVLDPLGDQQLGGVLMKLTAMIILLARFSIAFFRWYEESEGQRRVVYPKQKGYPQEKQAQP